MGRVAHGGHEGIQRRPLDAGCSDQPDGCNIYVEKKHNGEERFDCFTLGCGEGSECLPVEQGSHEEDGEKTTIWVCTCVRTKKPPVAAA